MAEKNASCSSSIPPLSAGNFVSHLKSFHPAQAIFPAVTVPGTGQLSDRPGPPARTASWPTACFFDDLRKVMFWEQEREARGRAAHLGEIPRPREEGSA
jgi:hypothetical protein